MRPVGAMLAKLYKAFIEEEATLVEVNPMIVTPAREVKALDAKVTLDGNALFRHAENASLREQMQKFQRRAQDVLGNNRPGGGSGPQAWPRR